MKSLNISKYVLITIYRRFLRVVKNFPIVLIFVVVLVVLASYIPNILRKQLVEPLSYAPETEIYFMAEKLFSLLASLFFIAAYCLSLFLPDIINRWPALAASPTRLGVLWTGMNSIALYSVSFLTYLSIYGLPALFREDLSLAPLPIIFNHVSLLTLIVLTGSIAICVWKISHALTRPQINVWISYSSKILPPLAVSSFLGFPALVKQPYKIFFHPGFLAADIFAQKNAQTAWIGFAFLVFSAIVFLIAAVFLLDNYWGLRSDSSNHEKLSEISLSGKPNLNFIWLELKRYFRQKSLMLMLVLLYLIIFLFVWAISRISQEMGSLSGLFTIQILPYCGAILGLMGLSQDHDMQWLYKSSPLPRLKYLWLKLLGISFLSLLCVGIATLSISVNEGLIAFILLASVALKTLGMVGIAFLISGIIKSSPHDLLGQIVPALFFFLASSVYQKIADAVVLLTNTPDLEIFNPLWILPFVFAPWIILGAEKYFEKHG